VFGLLLSFPVDGPSNKERLSSFTSQQFDPKNSRFIKILLDLIQTESLDLFEKFPVIFYKIVQIVLLMIHHKSQSTTIRALNYLVTNKIFWSCITSPLIKHKIGNLSDMNFDSDYSNRTLYSQQLFCISSILDLLAFERYGIIENHLSDPKLKYNSQEEIEFKKQKYWISGKVIQVLENNKYNIEYNGGTIDQNISFDLIRPKKVSSIYVTELLKEFNEHFSSLAQNNCNLSIYLEVDTQPSDLSYQFLEKLAENIGVRICDLFTIDSCYNPSFQLSKSSKWMKVSKLGVNYIYSAKNILINSGMSVSNTMSEMIEAIKETNINFSIYHSQLQLLKSWSVFMEIYILPRSSGIFPSDNNKLGSNINPMSPMIPSNSSEDSNQPSALVSSSNETSLFLGDIRSYEILKCIRIHLENFSDLKDFKISSLEVISIKSQLFLHMLHHQLFEIKFRSKDPSHSLVSSRAKSYFFF
jgi:hypothetical protein